MSKTQNYAVRLLLCVAVCALLTGCIGTHVTMPGASDTHYQSSPMPPLPQSAMRLSYTTTATTNETAAPLVAAPNKTIRISWQRPETTNEFVYVFYVYSAPTPSLDAMTFRTRTTNLFAEFPCELGQEHFAVRAVYSGNRLSPWGTK